MGLLVDGIWHDRWYDTKPSKGRFVRKASQLRNWITQEGEPCLLYTSDAAHELRV